MRSPVAPQISEKEQCLSKYKTGCPWEPSVIKDSAVLVANPGVSHEGRDLRILAQ